MTSPMIIKMIGKMITVVLFNGTLQYCCNSTAIVMANRHHGDDHEDRTALEDPDRPASYDVRQ